MSMVRKANDRKKPTDLYNHRYVQSVRDRKFLQPTHIHRSHRCPRSASEQIYEVCSQTKAWPCRQRSEQWASEHSLYNSQHTEEEHTAQPPLSSARLTVNCDPDLRVAVYFESEWDNSTILFTCAISLSPVPAWAIKGWSLSILSQAHIY